MFVHVSPENECFVYVNVKYSIYLLSFSDPHGDITTAFRHNVNI